MKLAHDMYEAVYSIRRITRKLKLAEYTIRKYLKTDAITIHALYSFNKNNWYMSL